MGHQRLQGPLGWAPQIKHSARAAKGAKVPGRLQFPGPQQGNDLHHALRVHMAAGRIAPAPPSATVLKMRLSSPANT